MDDHSHENWRKVKLALEQSGKTDCFFYRQACKAVAGLPLDEPLGSNYGVSTKLSERI